MAKPSNTLSSILSGLYQGWKERADSETALHAKKVEKITCENELLRGMQTLKDIAGSKFDFNIVARSNGTLTIQTNIGGENNPLVVRVNADNSITAMTMGATPAHTKNPVLLSNAAIPLTKDKNEVLKFIASKAAAQGLIF